jgi:phospholipid-binding lipoprotein MlaA
VPAGSSATAEAAISAVDPWEGWNRKVFEFNDVVDNALLKPVATGYRDYVPEPVRTGIGNVLGNFADAWSAVNQLLQGKVQSGAEMGMRVLTNSIFGLGGIIDLASPLGLTRRPEDFGQTLGHWGFGDGPYVVLPLLGPSTLRDTAGWLVDRQFSPVTLPATKDGQYGLTLLALIDLRASLLATTKLLDAVALDRYSFVRDAYLQRRRDALYDGAPPMQIFEDDPAEEPAGTAPAVPAAPASAASAPM